MWLPEERLLLLLIFMLWQTSATFFQSSIMRPIAWIHGDESDPQWPMEGIEAREGFPFPQKADVCETVMKQRRVPMCALEGSWYPRRFDFYRQS